MEWSSLESEGGRPSALYIFIHQIDVLCCVSPANANAVKGREVYTRAFLTSSLGITPSFSS